jgi:putative membrane protein
MPITFDALPSLLWGTLVLRPYVAAFLLVFLVAGARDLGIARVLGFLAWGSAVAFAAEWTSTRIGIPFGLYHYTGQTRGMELYFSNVPVFDSLSFPFLAYAAFCLARWALQTSRGAQVVVLAGVLMTLLDVVIDPLAVRGDRWFLGRIFYYPAGGAYFGVPLSNFGGWLLVGWMTVGGYLGATRAREASVSGRVGLGIGLYYGVLAFNLIITGWIGATGLLMAGILVSVAGGLVLYGVSVRSRSERRGGVIE